MVMVPSRLLLGLTITFPLLAPGCGPPEAAPRTELIIGGQGAFPESITSTRDGTIFASSVGSGGIFRAAPGAATATQWIAPGDHGLLDTFGVLADESSGTLWVCSSRMDPPAAGTAPAVPALYRYDLRTGAFRSRHPLPGGTGLCSDIAIGPDKAVYVAELVGGRILRLPPGSQTLETWATATELRGADGLDFLDRALFVNSFHSGKLFRIALNADGSAGAPFAMATSRPLTQPDGMRRLNTTQLVMAEGAGTIDLLTVRGNTVEVRTLRSSLTGPSAVAVAGSTVWALEAKLSLRGTSRPDPAPFKAHAVPLMVRVERKSE